MKMKQLLAAVLALSMSVALSACAPASVNKAPQTYLESANTYTQRLAGVDAATSLFTVNGREVPADYYLYWLAYDCYYWDYMQLSSTGTALDFTAELADGVTVGEFLKDDAKDLCTYYILMEQQAEANNCGLTEQQKAEWEQTKADYITANGQEAFDAMMVQTGVTMDTFERISVCQYLYQNLQDTLFPQPTEEEVDAYLEANEVYAAKHILIRTAVQDENGEVIYATGDSITNEDGTAYTGTAEEFNAAARQRAEDIIAQLDAAEDPVALFDELMKAHSEDPGLTAYPDGYTFGPGEMVPEFEDGTKALAYNGISGIVESPTTGYHIILRLKPDVSEDLTAQKMDALVTQWLDEAEIATTPTFDTLDAAAVYAAHQNYQLELNMAGATGETETGTPDAE